MSTPHSFTFAMKFFLLFSLLTGFLIVNAQDAAELNRRNGFKGIKLGSSIDSVKGIVFKKEFKEKDEFPAKLYDVRNENYKTIGEVTVKEIQLMTYQDRIYKIVVTTEKDPRVMRALEMSYGKSTYSIRTGSYHWNAVDLSLTFHAFKNSLELTYRSRPVLRKMQEDKGKKVTEISEDF